MFKAIAAFFKKIFSSKPAPVVIHPAEPIAPKPTVPQVTAPVTAVKEDPDAYKKLPWMKVAYSYVGLHETAGPAATKKIADWLEAVGQDRNDEIPWCAAAANGVLREAGYKHNKRADARSLLDIGTPLTSFKPGCIVVFWRGSIQGWQGHVAFGEKVSPDGKNIRVLGGNQGNEFNSTYYSVDRVLGYRWPEKA